MTQHLETLKEILQHEFTKTHMSEDYVEAIADGIYSCQFETVTALEEWIKTWTKHIVEITKSEKHYQRGVQFVAEQWDRVLSKDKGGR